MTEQDPERVAEHIEEGYEDRGVSEKEAERRAWATVNKETGGGNKSGSGRGMEDTTASAKRSGKGDGIRGPTGGGPIRLGQEGGPDPEGPRRPLN